MKKKEEIYQKDKMKMLDSTKACTLFGYVYFQKQIGDKSFCICYDYTGACIWTKEKLKNFDNIFVLLIFYIQLWKVGYGRV